MRAPLILTAFSVLLLASLACSRADVPASAPTAEAVTEPLEEKVPEPTAVPTDMPAQLPDPTPAPTLVPTPTPIAFTGEQVGEGEVSLEIPGIGVQAPLERAEEVMGSSGPAFTKPENNPLWVPAWGAEIGQSGVALIYGHRQWGPVPKVFTSLDKLEIGDTISVTGGGETLTFAVTESVVVYPDEFWPTFFRYDDAALEEEAIRIALLTCTPWGTRRQRLIVFAELVTPEEVPSNLIEIGQ